MKAYIRTIRLAQCMADPWLATALVLSCAIDVPGECNGHGPVAPVATMVFSIAGGVTFLGMHLSTARPTASAAAYALLDVIRNADGRTVPSLDLMRIVSGDGTSWRELRDVLDEGGIPSRYEPANPRIWRKITELVGDRPGGLKLKPDLTGRDPADRKAHLPKGGSIVSLNDACSLVRARLRSVFPGPVPALVPDPVVQSKLGARLRQIAMGGTF